MIYISLLTQNLFFLIIKRFYSHLSSVCLDRFLSTVAVIKKTFWRTKNNSPETLYCLRRQYICIFYIFFSTMTNLTLGYLGSLSTLRFSYGDFKKLCLPPIKIFPLFVIVVIFKRNSHNLLRHVKF